MLIDTHCHLDADQFADDVEQIIKNAADQDVKRIVIPSISTKNFARVKEIAHSFHGGYYALGIHPFCVDDYNEKDIIVLEEQVQQNLHDPKFVAIGEIGLDFYESKYKNTQIQTKQENLFAAQVKIAHKYKLPVILHIRKSHDRVLKILRNTPDVIGVAHAFNASEQQAQQFINLGFKLGLGGAFTYSGSKRIRGLVKNLGIQHWVLETDAPYMLPAWLDTNQINQPAEVAKIAFELADFLNISLEEIKKITTENAKHIFKKLD